MSHTNQIVVGVVVGVGGAILLAIAALLFLYYRKRNSQVANQSWTFWRKSDKNGTDAFLDDELGVRDRKINQGSNF